MKRLSEYINEQFFSESVFDKNLVKKDIKYHPKTKDELIDCIKEQLEIQGPDANLNIIDVSKITDMTSLFSSLELDKNLHVRNIDISQWDVSHVKYFGYMFFGQNEFNCDLSKWDVSRAQYMGSMFSGCTSFNSDLSKWDMSKVKDIENMFNGCKKFNCDLSKWDMSSLKTSTCAFMDCDSLKKIPSWYK